MCYRYIFQNKYKHNNVYLYNKLFMHQNIYTKNFSSYDVPKHVADLLTSMCIYCGAGKVVYIN
jgi:hypothetical protein